MGPVLTRWGVRSSFRANRAKGAREPGRRKRWRNGVLRIRRLHIPLMLLLTLYLVERFGPRLRDTLTNLTEVTHAQGYLTGNHYAPQEDLERLDMEDPQLPRH